jgi:ABC-type branched-subunit amino acid transport system substrate-binding protein
VKKLLQDAGYTIAGDIIGYNNSATDFSPYAAKIMATGADACFACSGVVTPTGNILKNIRDAGSNMLFMIANSVIPTDYIKTAGAKEATNVVDCSAGYIGNPNSSPMLQMMIQRYQQSTQGAALVTLEYANPVYELDQAFKAANSFGPQTVKTTLENMTGMSTFYGPATVSGIKTFGINHAISYQLPITTIDNGVATFKQWEPAIIP